LEIVKNTQAHLQERNGELQDWKSLCLSRNVNNVGPQKAFNVVAICLPSHGNFEEQCVFDM